MVFCQQVIVVRLVALCQELVGGGGGGGQAAHVVFIIIHVNDYHY